MQGSERPERWFHFSAPGVTSATRRKAPITGLAALGRNAVRTRLWQDWSLRPETKNNAVFSVHGLRPEEEWYTDDALLS